MERTFTFTVSATIEDPSALGGLPDDELGEAESSAIEAARTALRARYGSLEALLADAAVAEELD